MATGTGNLPNPGMSFSPFAILTAEEMNNIVENVESVADGSGIGDGALNGAVVLQDKSVSNAKLAANAAWTSWTPTFTNLSGGTLNFAKYQQIGKTVNFKLQYTLSGAGVGSAPTFTLPVAATSDYSTPDYHTYGEAVYRDVSASATWKGIVRTGSSTTGILGQVGPNGSYTLVGSIGSTAPFTWASGDVLFLYGTYEAA